MLSRCIRAASHRALSPLLCLSVLGAASALHAQPPAILTQHNDNARTGANMKETILTPANVNVNTFGKLFSRTLDAQVCGQVLYVPNLKINGAVHNVIFCATSSDRDDSPNSVYAFDADDPAQSAPLWRHKFPNGGRWMSCAPVIDNARHIIYVLCKETDNNGPHKLHALSLISGNEMPGSPITVAATVRGTGVASSNGFVSFDTTHANSRTGLLLVNSTVYFGISHSTDSPPYHGWVFGYRYTGKGFVQTGVFNTSPDGSEDGVWQSGNGIAADSQGYLYVATGNGTFNVDRGGKSYGMSYIKLSTPDLKVVDFFTPNDQQPLSRADLDLGNAGVLNIPGTNRLFGGATKFGSAFLMDSTNLGGFTPGGPDKVLQRLDHVCSNNNVGQNPVAWDTGNEKYVYIWPRLSPVIQYRYDPSVGKLNPAGVWKQNGGFTSGGALAVTSNGNYNGILWAIGRESTIHAYDANDLSRPELWNSIQNKPRDVLVSIGRFQFPTIVNGKLYAPSGNQSIVVYGLLPTKTATVTLSPIADAYVRSGVWANKNFGNNDQIDIKKDSDGSTSDFNRCVYLKFDLTGIKAAPKSAVLSLTVQSTSTPAGSGANIGLYDIADSTWTETGITWNNAPGLDRTNFSSTGSLVTSRTIFTSPGTVSVDVTAFVKAHLGHIATLQLIDTTSENVFLVMASKESTGFQPNLLITP